MVYTVQPKSNLSVLKSPDYFLNFKVDVEIKQNIFLLEILC